MEHIAIFVSGTGSNAKKIIEYFQNHPNIHCDLLISNKATAPALEMAKTYGLDTFVLNRSDFYDSTQLLTLLEDKKISFIVLAGFLWLIPPYLIQAFPKRMVNIHPALLPKYGGKGMYGMHVHQAVKDNQENESGITIHLVNEHYDEGATLFQAACILSADDTPKEIAKKVQVLEHLHFAPQIEKHLRNLAAE